MIILEYGSYFFFHGHLLSAAFSALIPFKMTATVCQFKIDLGRESAAVVPLCT